MVVEISKNKENEHMLRIRVRSLGLFKEGSIRTQVLGEHKRLERLAGRLKATNGFETYAWHLKLEKYTPMDAATEIDSLADKKYITPSEHHKADALLREWYNRKR